MEIFFSCNRNSAFDTFEINPMSFLLSESAHGNASILFIYSLNSFFEISILSEFVSDMNKILPVLGALRQEKF